MPPKLTPIFPTSIKPVYHGVYHVFPYVGRSTVSLYSYWNGKTWGYTCSELLEASFYQDTADASSSQRYPWRGLANKPRGFKP